MFRAFHAPSTSYLMTLLFMSSTFQRRRKPHHGSFRRHPSPAQRAVIARRSFDSCPARLLLTKSPCRESSSECNELCNSLQFRQTDPLWTSDRVICGRSLEACRCLWRRASVGLAPSEELKLMRRGSRWTAKCSSETADLRTKHLPPKRRILIKSG